MPPMAFELRMLALAALIGVVQLVAAAFAAEGQRKDPKWNMGPRDEPKPPVTGVPGRLVRAFANYQETFPLFAAAVTVAYLGGQLSWATAWGSGIYVAARAVFVLLYAFGVPVVRTLTWIVSMMGLLMVLFATLV